MFFRGGGDYLGAAISGGRTVNQTKIKGSCQSGRKVVTNNSKVGLPL